MANEDNFNTELRYAQWNPFFNSEQRDIDEIRAINKTLRSNLGNLDIFYQLINTFFNNHRQYIKNESNMQLSMDKMEKKIYDPMYINDNKKKQKSSKLLLYQHKIIKYLERCWQIIQNDLSDNSLLPKVIIKKKRDAGRAIFNE